MNYWSRITSPGNFPPAAEAFDKLMLDTFCMRMKLPPLTDEARTQVVLPVRVGGFGLSSMRIVSPAAWYCSFAHAFTRIRPLVPSLDTLTDDIACVGFFSKYLYR